jgi:hypothetical protein
MYYNEHYRYLTMTDFNNEMLLLRTANKELEERIATLEIAY